MRNYFITLLILAVSLFVYSCGGAKKEPETDTKQEETTEKKEEQKEPTTDELVVGKWEFQNMAIAPAYLDTKTDEIRKQFESEVKEQNEEGKGSMIEFFQGKDYKVTDKNGKEEDAGKYELRANGTEIIIKSDKGEEDKFTIKKITASTLEVEMVVEVETERIPYIMTYTKK